MNRDDDLYDAKAMKDLCKWDKTKQMKKLKLIKDPLAHKLLVKILSPKPSDRYKSMSLLLEDDYFDAKNLAEHFDDWQKKMEDAIRKHTVDLRNTKKEIIAKITDSTSVTLTAIFEASEVQTPTSFIILPEKVTLGVSDTYDTAKYVASKVSKAVGYIEDAIDIMTDCIESPKELAVDYIEDVIDMATDYIESPKKFAEAFVKSRFFEKRKTMFLYLVDEWTGQPVTSASGVYPVEIEVQSELAKKLVPLMALGIQVLALTNDAAKIISMFYPPLQVISNISKVLLKKADGFIEASNKSGIIEQVVKQGSTDSETVRGNELREFVKFLKEKDPDCTFSGLRRICDKSSGNAIWVTEESAKTITEENEAANNQTANDNVEGDSRLGAEVPNVEGDNQLEEEVRGLKEENSRLRLENSRLRLKKQQNFRCLPILGEQLESLGGRPHQRMSPL
jgi:hypothetical protein